MKSNCGFTGGSVGSGEVETQETGEFDRLLLRWRRAASGGRIHA